jgi:acetyltransferase
VTGGVISQPTVFERCIRRVVEDDSVSALFLQFGNSGGETIETCKDELLAVQSESSLPIVTVFTGGQPSEETATELREEGVFLFEDPVRAMRVLRVLADQRAVRDRMDRFPARVDWTDRRPLRGDSWEDVFETLGESGVSFARTEPVADADEAVLAAESIGYLVAMKLDPLAVEHKSEVGGVRTELSTEDAVRTAYEELRQSPNDAGIHV